MPAKVELLLAQKHYLLATKLVLDACRLLDTEGLTGIGALADLRRILDQRRNVRSAEGGKTAGRGSRH